MQGTPNNINENENLRDRILSENTEGHSHLTPSDAIWDNIDHALGKKKKKRRGFILFFFLGFGVAFIYLWNFNHQNEIQIIAHSQDLEQVDNKMELIIEDKEVKINEVERNKKVEKQRYADGLKTKSKDRNSNTLVSQTFSKLNSVNSSNATSKSLVYSKEKWKKPENILSPENIISQYSNEIQDINPTSSIENDKGQTLVSLSPKQNSELNLLAASPLLPSIQTILFMEPTILELNGMKMVKKTKENTNKFLFRSFTSKTNYRIIKEQTLGTASFNLQSSVSFGYELFWLRQINEKWEIGFGIGLDHSHFIADYSINLRDPKSSIQDVNGIYNLSYAQALPSLAGGLSLDLDVNSNVEQSNDDELQLKLGHNYKTITVPAVANYYFKKSEKWNAYFGAGMQYSKRLLSLDTQVDVSDFSNKNYSLESLNILPVEINTQPFAIHNVSSIVQFGVDVSILKVLSIQTDFRMTTPLRNIYKDQSFTVRTRQFQLGLGLIYKLP